MMQQMEEKHEKTPEDLAAIAYLDRLRNGEGEAMPVNLPRACVVEVTDYEEVPKANEKYAMVAVTDGTRSWKMCINRYYLDAGMRALFVSEDAAIPIDDERFDNLDAVKLKERVFNFGFGVKVRHFVVHVKHVIYRFNCGILYPLDDFHEILDAPLGTDVSARLRIDSLADLQAHLSAPRPKRPKTQQTFVPKAKRKPKKMSFFEKIKAQRDRLFG